MPPVVIGRYVPTPVRQIFPPSHPKLVIPAAVPHVSPTAPGPAGPSMPLPSAPGAPYTVPVGQTAVPTDPAPPQHFAPLGVAHVTIAPTAYPNVTIDPLFGAAPSAAVPLPCSGAPLGLNQYNHLPHAQAPIPVPAGQQPSGDNSQNSILTALVYHVDRMANPETSTKAGAVENIRRNEEILVYVARFFDNNTVALCPGGVRETTGYRFEIIERKT